MTSPISRLSSFAVVGSLACLACTSTGLSQAMPFPMTPVATAPGEVTLAPSHGLLAGLTTLDRVELTGVPLPDGGQTTLRLQRVPLLLHARAVHVDGVVRDDVETTLSLWSGTVVGLAGSQAFLAFSTHGSRGWFGEPGRLHHLLAEPGDGGDWSRARGRLVTDAWVQRTGARRELHCNLVAPGARPTPPGGAGGGGNVAGQPLIEAPIAFETDYEFFALFNDLRAAQAYAFALIGAVGDRYREQLDVIFTLPYVGFHTTNTDPWTTDDCFGRLDQFRLAWDGGGAPVRAELYHMISGVPVSGCGGVAYLDVLCNQDFGFGMSAHINGQLPFPPAQGPMTWDFFVIAHELGHNFGTRHTHDYTPPIDQCASGACISNGTNMSYCHSCAGGMRNITLRFHPRVVTTIRAAVASSCLRPFHGVLVRDLGFALAGSNGTPVQSVSYAAPAVQVGVASAPRSQAGVLVIGGSEARIPFFGGTLLPSPDLAVPMLADASGNAAIGLPVSGSFPAGIVVWMHSWFLDPAGPRTFAASGATRVELIRP